MSEADMFPPEEGSDTHTGTVQDETLPAEYVPRTGVGRLKPGLGKGKGKVGGKGKGKGGGKGGGKGKGSGKGKGGEGAGKVNGGAGKADTHPKKGRMMTQSSRAGLIFPVGRVHRMIKANVFKGRVSGSAAVYVAAFMEYICKEVLEGAANKAKQLRQKRINPRHIMLAIRTDLELSRFIKATIANSGSVPKTEGKAKSRKDREKEKKDQQEQELELEQEADQTE